MAKKTEDGSTLVSPEEGRELLDLIAAAHAAPYENRELSLLYDLVTRIEEILGTT